MSQVGYTPIQLYYSTTASAVPAPARLVSGELAINIRDGKLYYKDNAGAVQLLADKSSATGNLPGGNVGTLVYQSAPGVTAYLPLSTSNWILTSGSTAPQYSNPNAVSVGYANSAGTVSNIAGGAANKIVYQDGANSTNFIVAPTVAGKVLSWTGSTFDWVSAPAATTATSIAGGGVYQIPYQSAPSTTVFSANLTFNGSYLKVGPGFALGAATNPLVVSAGSANQYVQSYIRNDSNGASSSADFVAYTDNSTDVSGWADMGFTSSGYADVTYSVTGPNEAYFFASAPSGSSTSGNAVYATDSTGTTNAHQWYVGGFNQAKSAWKMQLDATGLHLSNALAPSSGGTGITNPGAAGNVLTSDGTNWVSTTPVPAVSKAFVYFCAQF